MKSPAFQFYCGDWLRAAELRMCSIAARGLWIDMIAFMHQAQPYGHLIFAGQPVSLSQLARMVGEGAKTVDRLLAELRSAGVYSVDDHGVIYCRRMVRDELERAAWREQQRAHRERVKTKEEDSQQDVSPMSGKVSGQSQSVLPSSDLQSSETKQRRASRLPPDWVLPDEWKAWALHEQPSWNQTHAAKVGANFKDHWLGAPKGLKLDWLATWRKWVRNERPLPNAPHGAAQSMTKAQAQIAEQRKSGDLASAMPESLQKFVRKPH